MAENKRSFVLYADLIHTVNKISDEDAGILLKTILSYVNDLNPSPNNVIVDLVFEPIKQQLKRDLKHWERIKEKRSDAGKASAEAKKAQKEHEQQIQQVLTNSTSVNKTQQSSTNSTVSVTVNDTVNVINISFSVFWDLYDKKKGDKEKLEKKWNALSSKDREKIIAYLPDYKKSTPDKTYRKDPQTFLNNKSWNDEIISSQSSPKLFDNHNQNLIPGN